MEALTESNKSFGSFVEAEVQAEERARDGSATY
jgi:hypothetical protein